MRIDSSGYIQMGAPISTHIGTSQLFVNRGVNAAAATSGTTQTGGALRLRGGNNAVLDMGMNSVNTWIQATDRANLALGYPLSLNPNGGNVGIGTTSPGAKLDIDGGFFRVKGDQPVGAYYYGIMYDGTNLRGTTQTNILYSGSTIAANTTVTDYAGLRIDAPSTAASGAVITNNYGIYQASSAQKNYFGGNVGIGTTSPSAKLEISGFSTGAGLKLNYGNSSGTIEAVNFKANGGANGVIGMQMVSAGVGDLWLGGSGGRSLTLYRDGNVGIGDTNPDQKLVVTNGNIKLKSNADGNNGILMLYDAAGAQSGQVYPSAGDLRIWSPNDVLILPTGNVGIGTDNPIAPLHVAGNAVIETGSPDLYFATTNATHTNWRVAAQETVNQGFEIASGTTSAGSNAVSDTYTTRFVIINSGNVGIGDSNPGAKLDVNGAIKLSGSGNGQEVQFVKAQGGTFSTVTIELQFPGAGSYNYEVGVSGTSGCGIQFGGGYTNGVSNFSHTGNQQVGGAWTITTPSSNLVRLVSPSGTVGTHPTAYVKARWGLTDGFDESDISITFS
jgi:hypothetical protein